MYEDNEGEKALTEYPPSPQGSHRSNVGACEVESSSSS